MCSGTPCIVLARSALINSFWLQALDDFFRVMLPDCVYLYMLCHNCYSTIVVSVCLKAKYLFNVVLLSSWQGNHGYYTRVVPKNHKWRSHK
jgi:hypothetical protein